MADDFLVTISGPALALLLYENARIHDQFGFLLGETLIYVTKKVTDSDRDVEHVKKHIHIKSVVAYPIGEPFFDSIGQIDEVKLNSFLGANAKNVIGWYHYRKEFRLITTMRDKTLHTELSKYFSKINQLQAEENFILCVLTSLVNETGGTHKFKHLLLRKQGGVYKPVSLKINNLGADATRPDGTDYKLTPIQSSCHSDAFDKVYDKIKDDLKKVSGVNAVNLIEKTAEHLLMRLIPEVSKSDQEISRLEQQLGELRKRKFAEEFAKAEENPCFQLERQMRQMEVDTKSDISTDRNSPKSPDIFEDLPKSQSSSTSEQHTSNVKSTKRHVKQESSSSSENRSPDVSIIDRDLLLIKGKSPPVDTLRLQESPGRLSKETGTIDRNKASKCKQRTDQFIETSAANINSYSTGNRSIRQSPNHESGDT